MFAALPNEILDMILDLLPLCDIKTFLRADKAIYKIVKDLYGDSIWPQIGAIKRHRAVIEQVEDSIYHGHYIYKGRIHDYILGPNFKFRYYHKSDNEISTRSIYKNRIQTSTIPIRGHYITTRIMYMPQKLN
jgi:hypothetical protein